jgi:NADH-quinone oxidoreductase subunit M
MLLSIIGLYFIHGRPYTFELSKLASTPLSSAAGMWLMLGFFAAFGVKLPVIGLHTWLPDAHTQAPTAGSVILAGLLLKTGGYGFIRFVLTLFPDAAHTFAPVAAILATAGILYGAMTSFAQTDFKRYVALTSVSHLGFVLLGVFSGNHLALLGAVVVMLAHGLSTGALFVVAGMLQQRLGTRDINSMGGLLTVMPRMGGVAIFFALASMGLPGLGNFVGEFMVLAGSYAAFPSAVVVSSFVLVLSVIYSLWLVYRAFQGPTRGQKHVSDLNLVEMGVFSVMIAGLLWIGLYPRPVLKTIEPALRKTENVQSKSQIPNTNLQTNSKFKIPIASNSSFDF